MRLIYLFLVVMFYNCSNKENAINFHESTIVSLIPPIDNIEFNTDGSLKYQETYRGKISHVKTPKGKFSIIIIDKNNNNSYDEIGKDLIGIEKFGVLETQKKYFSQIKNIIQFEINNEPFVITNLSKNGNDAILEWGTIDTLIDIHRMIDKLPNRNFKIVGEGTKEFQHFINANNSYVYINFWGSWCSPCVEKIPDLRELHDKYKGRLTIISLNWKDSEEVIEKYKSDFGMNWIQGISNEQINRDFLAKVYPHSMLFDHNGSLLEINIQPRTLEKKYFLSKF